MNQIRQIEVLKEMVRCRVLEREYLHKAMHAPVFIWQDHDLTEDEAKICSDETRNPDTGLPKIMPYPVFRISCKSWFDLWIDGGKSGMVSFRCVYEDKNEKNDKEIWFVTTYKGTLAESTSLRIFREGQYLSRDYLLNKSKLKVTENRGEETAITDEKLKEMMWAPFHSLFRFLFHLQCGAMTTLKVEPRAEGKSVEWRLSRTHYLLLPAKQAQSIASSRKGVSGRDVTRGAHWRRAHLRTLSSPRYTHKKGCRVVVRHAWVGPKEWIGLDGKIYKVIEKSSLPPGPDGLP